MSVASDQGLIESKVSLGRSTMRVPALVERQARRELARENAPRRGLTKAAWAAGFAVLGGMALAAGVEAWRSEQAASAAVESHVEPAKTVTILRPTPAAHSSVTLPATFRPWQTATLHARASGYLTAWHRDLGAVVKAGELLAEIETPELDQEVAEGEALASEAAAAAVQARAERTEAEAELKVVEAQLARVQAEYELGKSQLSRRDKLVQSRSISQEELDTYQRQLQARAAEVAAAQSDVARRRTNLQTRAAIIAAREATAKSRQSNVERLKELQAFKRIVAPFDGVITGRIAEVGMLVTAGKEPLFVIEDLSKIRVQLSVPQTYAMQTAPGVAATIRLPESQTQPVMAAITRIAESVDAASRTMLAEIELDNVEHHFQPGSYAQVTLAAPQSSSSWSIPTNALLMKTNGPHVALVNDQNQIEVKRVTLGRDLGDRVIVAEGIHGGERLVVNPGDGVATGVQVVVHQPADAARKFAER
ncbi:MAG TPA: efflux RND transporter periplasmic adaptor subunit [Pirellulaceae bacterium]|nr:efflux RND transporter periplasmic adaptor subunit [Pirellulaceae bacterium]